MLLLSIAIWYSRRSEPLALRDIQRGLAIVLLTLFLVPPELATSSCEAKESQPGPPNHVLREGTRIPPTTGRIVMVGRRWAFIPVAHAAEPDSTARGPLTVTHAFLTAEAKQRATRLGSSGQDYGLNRFKIAATQIDEVTRQLPPAFEQILLQENLMLQRIVKAIRSDATDDHWVISGEITEFFNENRLAIRLAQRANHH